MHFGTIPLLTYQIITIFSTHILINICMYIYFSLISYKVLTFNVMYFLIIKTNSLSCQKYFKIMINFLLFFCSAACFRKTKIEFTKIRIRYIAQICNKSTTKKTAELVKNGESPEEYRTGGKSSCKTLAESCLFFGSK